MNLATVTSCKIHPRRQKKQKEKRNYWDFIKIRSFAQQKINSKWMKDLIVRQDSIKILEENTGNTLFELGHSNFLQDTSMKVRETKAKMNYWDFIKINSFCTAKDTVNKTQRQPTEWEKIFANDISDKRLVSKIYKELIKLNSKEQTIQS